jgi:hypothetical protein
MGASMDQRGTSLSLYSVICPRCETVSPMDQPACPYCGADRHGAVLTKGAGTAVRAVEAARAVLHHAYERGELTPVEPLRPMQHDAHLPVPARALGLATIVPPRPAPVRKVHPALIAGVIAGVALGVVSWIRADLDRATPRSRLETVSAAGEVHKAQPTALVAAKAPEPAAQNRFFVTALPTTASLFNGATPISSWSSLSLPFACCAAPVAFAPDTRNVSASRPSPPATNAATQENAGTIKPAPEARKPSVARRESSAVHARVRQKNKAVVAQSSSNRQKVHEGACTSKNARRCADPAPRRASKEKEKEPNKRQAARVAKRDAPAKSDANAFQQVNAPPAPIKPAMTSDDSWKPSKKTN